MRHLDPAQAATEAMDRFPDENPNPVLRMLEDGTLVYDVWGDTVNTASRMESTGVPGRLQVRRETYDRLAGEFEFERRGIVDVKGKGLVETWFLLRRRGAPIS